MRFASFFGSTCETLNLLGLFLSSLSNTDTLVDSSLCLACSNFLEYAFSKVLESLYFGPRSDFFLSFTPGRDSNSFSREELLFVAGLKLLTSVSWFDFSAGGLELSNVSFFALNETSNGLEIVAKFGESKFARSREESATLLKSRLSGDCW